MVGRVAALISLLLVGCVNIEAGEVGVLVNKCSGGGIDSKPLSIGYHFVGPFCEDVKEYETNLKTYTTEVHSPSKDGLDIISEVSLSYQVDPSMAPIIWGKFKAETSVIEKIYMDRVIKDALREQFSLHGGEEVYTKQQDIRSSSEAKVKELLKKDGFLVQALTINKSTLPDAVVQSIQAKVTQAQRAQTQSNKIEETRALAQQEITRAEGEAKARLIKADAEAKYIRTINEALTPAYIGYVRAQKWNGQLPKVTGGSTLVDLRDEK